MLLQPRRGFKKIVKLLEIINPFLVIFSIIGLFMEYTYLKKYVLNINQIISVLFVFDFLIRLLAHSPGKYFFKAYGWVDFLASLPGFMLFLGNTPLLSMFKIVRIGRFFRIIRILRFLRVFNFLKKMKSDSSWVQDRIMQIGVTIVLISVVGIIFVDSKVQNYLLNLQMQRVLSEYKALNRDINKLVQHREDIVFYIDDSKLYNNSGGILLNEKQMTAYMTDEMENYIIIPFKSGNFSLNGRLELPEYGVIIHEGVIREYQNTVMLILLSTLLIILIVIIFYMGFKFAKDMQVVQLVIDSFDAGDYMLLKQESDQYRDDNGDLVIEPDESEIISLLKTSANIAVNSDISSTTGIYNDLGSIIDTEESDASDLEDIKYQLENIENKIEADREELIKDTIKRVTPAITKYIYEFINKKKS